MIKLIDQLKNAARHVSSNGGAPCRSDQTLYWIAAERLEQLEPFAPENLFAEHPLLGVVEVYYTHDQLLEDVSRICQTPIHLVLEMAVDTMLEDAAIRCFIQSRDDMLSQRIRQALKDLREHGQLIERFPVL
jgi:MarR-like DNA-binding transcriptional regulator SgrR of sgrS sRNA